MDFRKLSKKAVTWNQDAVNLSSVIQKWKEHKKNVYFYDVLPFMQDILCQLFAEWEMNLQSSAFNCTFAKK